MTGRPPDPAERIPGVVQRYLSRFPDERQRLEPLLDRLAAPAGLFDRGSMSGHVTGSAFVVDPRRDLILLVHHAALDRWLQPGGHVDAEEEPGDGAAREVWEETGLQRFAPSDWARATAPGISLTRRASMRWPALCPSGTDLMAACTMFSAQPKAKPARLSARGAPDAAAAQAMATG